jgi:hypothetical protein
MISVTDISYSGNGFTATFDDGSVGNGQFKVVSGVLTVIGLTADQQSALNTFNNTINIDDPRFKGNIVGPTGATGPPAAGGLERQLIEFIGKGTGASKTTTTIIGTSVIGESFGIGDEIYLNSPVPINVDRTIDAGIHFGWVPAGAESNKTVSWDLDILSMDGNTIASTTTGSIQAVDEAVPSIQFESTETTVVLPSATYLGPNIQTLHLRIKRVASTSDPVAGPIVVHAHFEYTKL